MSTHGWVNGYTAQDEWIHKARSVGAQVEVCRNTGRGLFSHRVRSVGAQDEVWLQWAKTVATLGDVCEDTGQGQFV